MHAEQHPLAGRTVALRAEDPHRGLVVTGVEFRVEDWWDRTHGKSWMDSVGNPAALCYAMRTGPQLSVIPIDDEVVYGKIGSFGHLVHASELGEPVPQ